MTLPRSYFVTGLLTLVLATGCARFKNEPISPGQSVANLENRSLEDPRLREFLERNLGRQIPNWPLHSWDFETLTLAALFYNPTLDIARAQWATAQAGKITAGQHPNPTLNLLPGYDTTTAIPSPWLPLGSIDIPIETAGKRKHRIAQASELSEAARLNIASTAWQVRSSVKRGLLDLQAAQETLALLREQQTLQSENLNLLQRQQEAGGVTAFEVAQAGIAANSNRLALRDAERQMAEARVRLAATIGVPSGALAHVELSFEGLNEVPAEASLDLVRQQALLNRSDILSSLAEYAASQYALQLEIAKQYPDVHLGPGYQYNQGDNQWLLGVTVTLPILNQNQGPIAEAIARRAESAARFNALQASVLSQIDQAAAGFHSARQKQADADALLQTLRKQAERSHSMFELGEISRSELLGQQLQLSASSLARLEARSQSQQALAALEDALQRPLAVNPQAWETNPRPATESTRK